MAPKNRHYDEDDISYEGEKLGKKGFHVVEEDEEEEYEDEDSLNPEAEEFLRNLDPDSLQGRLESIEFEAEQPSDPYEGWTQKQLQAELDRLTGRKNTNPRDIVKERNRVLTAMPQTSSMLEQHVELALLELKQFSAYLNKVIENIEALRRLHEQE